jgi:hypothetical protein
MRPVIIAAFKTFFTDQLRKCVFQISIGQVAPEFLKAFSSGQFFKIFKSFTVSGNEFGT